MDLLSSEHPMRNNLIYNSESRTERIDTRGEIEKSSELEQSSNPNLGLSYQDTVILAQTTVAKHSFMESSLSHKYPGPNDLIRGSDLNPGEIVPSDEMEDFSELEQSSSGDILTRGRRQTRTTLRIGGTVSSPISFAPSEILLHIFRDYIADSPYFTPPGCLTDVTFAPWLLGQVCQEWRDVSRSTSYLWRKVEICSPPQELASEEGIMEKRRNALSHLLSAQMKLSKAYPLEVSLDLDALSTGEHHNLLDIILPHRHRFRTLHLAHIPDREEEELSQPLPEMDPSMKAASQRIFLPISEAHPLVFTLLEELTIMVDAQTTTLDIFSNSSFPRLTKLYYGKGLFAFSRMTPWSNLREVFIHVVWVDDLLPILPHLTGVTRLIVGYLLYSEDHISEGDIAVLPCLEELSMWKGWAPAMAVMTAPCLRYLIIGDGTFDGDIDVSEDIEAIIIMAHRSSAPISKLRMCLPVPLDPSMESLLSSLPNLVELEIELHDSYQDEEVSFIAHLTDALCATNLEGAFLVCPKLSKIIVYNESSRWIEEDVSMAFLEMLEARHSDPGRTFSSAILVKLWETSGSEDTLGWRLEALRSRGLDVSVVV